MMQSGEGEQRIENPLRHDLRNVRKIKHKAKIRFSQVKDDAGVPFLQFGLAVDGGQWLAFDRKGYPVSVENSEFVAMKCRRHPTNLIPQFTEAETSRLGFQYRSFEDEPSAQSEEID